MKISRVLNTPFAPLVPLGLLLGLAACEAPGRASQANPDRFDVVQALKNPADRVLTTRRLDPQTSSLRTIVTQCSIEGTFSYKTEAVEPYEGNTHKFGPSRVAYYISPDLLRIATWDQTSDPLRSRSAYQGDTAVVGNADNVFQLNIKTGTVDRLVHGNPVPVDTAVARDVKLEVRFLFSDCGNDLTDALYASRLNRPDQSASDWKNMPGQGMTRTHLTEALRALPR